jgi:predicted RNA binding protein YcfA (HicA-like mRNA interferase family)
MTNETSGAATVVPIHAGDLKPELLRTILKQAGLTPEQFLELLRD